MATSSVNIDFKTIGKSFREYVLDKAKQAGTTVVYVANGNLVEEDLKNGTIKILKESILSK